MVEDLLTRAQTGPGRRVAARTRAATETALRPDAIAEPQDDPDDDEPQAGHVVVPFGVFDAFTDGAR